MAGQPVLQAAQLASPSCTIPSIHHMPSHSNPKSLPLTKALAPILQVETYFISQGLLLPGSMPSYWIGLSSTANSWPTFSWLSALLPTPSRGSYSHWPPTVRQPDNAAGDEYCVAANSTLLHGKAWGWCDTSCDKQLAYICRQDVMALYNYTSPVTGSKYHMVSAPANGLIAEANCNSLGGHLVVYETKAEQQEVEAEFIQQGALLAAYQGAYWLGLQAEPYPEFHWLDRTIASPSNVTYINWADGQPGAQEDSNFCATANASLARVSSATAIAAGAEPWGWQSYDCTQAQVYICQVTRPMVVGYTSNRTDNIYVLDTQLMDRYAAEDSCIEQGGHVVSFASYEEQQEVEGGWPAFTGYTCCTACGLGVHHVCV